MRKELLLEACGAQSRLAVVEDGALCEMYFEREGREKLVGNIYMGRVRNVLPGMQAAFVDIGLDKNAFLHIGDIQLDPADFGGDAEALKRDLKNQSIKKLLHVGQELLVQVIKEPIGAKGPRITSHVTLPGRMAVLLPTVSYVGVSRRIEREDERARLRALAEEARSDGMGVIIRTAAENVDEAALSRDLEALARLWAALKQRAAITAAPALLHRDATLTRRAVRDMLSEEVERIVTDDAATFAGLEAEARLIAPEFMDRIRLSEDEIPLFDRYRLDSQLEKALSRRVWLKSGGYLVFDHAEALTVIDVNTGKYVGTNSLSDTVYKTNLEAAVEIARQLRLRDLGGIIVIDFIDMDEPEQREQLIKLFQQELKRDHTKTNLVGLTGLGLVEMTRKKSLTPLDSLMMRTCPTCGGSGLTLAEDAVAHAISRQLHYHWQDGCALVNCSEGVAAELTKLGAPANVRAYAVGEPLREPVDYDITAACESALPKHARRLPARAERMS